MTDRPPSPPPSAAGPDGPAGARRPPAPVSPEGPGGPLGDAAAGPAPDGGGIERDLHAVGRDADALLAEGRDAAGRLARRRRLAAAYEQWSTFPMFVAAMLWLIGVIFRYAPSLRDVYGDEARVLLFTTWCIFLVDSAVRFLLDPDRRTFARRYWPTLIALVVPPLRIVLIVSAVRRISSGRGRLAQRVGLYSLYGLTSVIAIGAAAVLIFEIDAPGATIRSYGDSVWWAIVTVVTVGYGDYTPVTVPGRVVAVVMMFAGVSVLSVVTAAVASRWIGRAQSEAAPDEQVTIADLQQQLAQIQAELARLTGPTEGTGGPGTPPDPDPRQPRGE